MLFLQETKCSYETLMRMGQKIWKGSSAMEIDAEGMGGNGNSTEPRDDRTLGMACQSFLFNGGIQVLRIRGHMNPGQHLWT